MSNANADSPKSKSSGRALPIIARLLLGIGFTLFGLNGLHPFMPQPKTPMPAAAMDFAGAMMKTGYMFKLVAGTQLVAGVLLILGLFVPLALVLLMPVLVNIIAFHLFLAPAPAAFAPGIVCMLLELYLAWVYRRAYYPMLAIRAKPG